MRQRTGASIPAFEILLRGYVMVIWISGGSGVADNE